MKAPKTLQGEALAYWKRHAAPLSKAGILTDRDRDSFALLCRVWGLLEEMETKPGDENYRVMGQFVNLTKQYQALAKQFGLLPRERKASQMMLEQEEPDEFGIG